ncbi:hypothetical protein SD80_017940 [Scytonema tolypothrichoides VB-61278]|nr:hypothetical protein SD80_017940 [Scytonema tolypothrichoides VB-61278]
MELPDTVLQQLPHNQQVKVIILVNEPSEDEDDLEASDTWSESDQLELTTFSLQYAASLYSESEETTE